MSKTKSSRQMPHRHVWAMFTEHWQQRALARRVAPYRAMGPYRTATAFYEDLMARKISSKKPQPAERNDPLSPDAQARTTVHDIAFTAVEKPRMNFEGRLIRDDPMFPRVGPGDFEAVPIEPVDDGRTLASTIVESNNRMNRPKSRDFKPIWAYVRPVADAAPIVTGFIMRCEVGIVAGRPHVLASLCTSREHVALFLTLTRRRIVRAKDSDAYESVIFEPSPPRAL